MKKQGTTRTVVGRASTDAHEFNRGLSAGLFLTLIAILGGLAAAAIAAM